MIIDFGLATSGADFKTTLGQSLRTRFAYLESSKYCLGGFRVEARGRRKKVINILLLKGEPGSETIQ